MKWLDRVRRTENTPGDDLTKPTEGAFVSFVSAPEPPIRDFETVNDPEFSKQQPKAQQSQKGERHMARVLLFTRRGLRQDDAEQIARDVAARNADFDDRHLCLECHRLSGNRCSVPNLAGAGTVVTPFMRLPQRCPGFEAET